MKIEKEFVLREIAGDYVIIPTGKTVLEFNGLATINEVGVFLWKLLENEITEDELVTKLLEEYEVDEETARKDVDEFLDVLVANKVLER